MKQNRLYMTTSRFDDYATLSNSINTEAMMTAHSDPFQIFGGTTSSSHLFNPYTIKKVSKSLLRLIESEQIYVLKRTEIYFHAGWLD